ncbi:hypothetical protein Anas_00255 [Armadillidium nasatum]|uniref:Major facilitator superfamily associated domain-containing protein n=1 Tax=Armadillidium nasatum TaxID=96803 RepID=A0A5N5THK0_9CRUS|nr:hypothetical protein Anas_00255 [Armadillidium nasatum]
MNGRTENIITGEVILINNSEVLHLESNFTYDVERENPFYLLSQYNQGECYPNELWDCKAICVTESFSVSHILMNEIEESKVINISSEFNKLYNLKNMENLPLQCESQLRFHCEGALYAGDTCFSLWKNPFFYLYLLFMTCGFVSFTTANSITDAICLDLISEDREYGNHRAWGTVGWGLMGPISGFLVDWYSGGNFGKNYLPAFMILFILGTMDLILSVLKLKVPKIEKTEDLWKSVGVIMKKPTFILFLMFVIMAGAFDGVVASYIFLLQEDMAKDTIYMKYMKFVQGLTIGVQCFLEAPFMWACGWFLKKISSSNLLSLVFALYAFRLLCLGLIGSYGPVWLTLLVEFLNGPCYGLGYTVTVVHAGLLTPPGTSATVQSITNICYESLGYALASLVGGIIYTYSGAPGVYYVFGLTAAVTFVLHFVTIRLFESKPDVQEESPKTVPLKATNEIVPCVEEQEQLMPAI